MHTDRPDPAPLPIPASQIVDVGPRGELVSSDGPVYARRIVDGAEAWFVDAWLSPPGGLRWVSLRERAAGSHSNLVAVVATTADGRVFWQAGPDEGWFEGEPFDRSTPYGRAEGFEGARWGVVSCRATSHTTVATCRDTGTEEAP